MNERDDDIDSLLAAERVRPEPGPAVKAAVAAKVAAVLGSAALEIAANAGAGAAAGASAGASAGAGAAATAGVSVAFKVALGVLCGALVGGGVVAVALPPRVVVQHEVRVQAPAAPAPPETPVTATPETPEPSSVPVSAAVRPARASASASAGPTPTARRERDGGGGHDVAGGRDVDLSRERALVDRARSALARGDSSGALAAADEHRKTFPRGQLAEEREVVAIQALAGAGRAEEAANRAGAFRKEYPASLLRPIVDAALRPR